MNELLDYLEARINAALDLAEVQIAMIWHEGMWGVPVGPTLTMVYPTKLRGLNELLTE